MLGRQSTLLVTNDDLSALEEMLRARGDVQFLSSRTNEGRNSLLSLTALPIAIADMGKVSRLCFLAPSDRAPSVEIEALSDVKVKISSEVSEIIEFWRSYCAEGQIQGGRIYYTVKYFEDGAFHDKSPEFAKWAQRVVAAIRRSLNYDDELLCYVGADAAKKIALGELKVIP